MKLHENKQLFKNAIDYIVQTHDLSTEIVVKDYYVTLALKMVYSSFEDLVFIGGTSLSKCFNIINRFSEDIDLAAVGTSRKGKQRKTEKVLQYFVKNWQYEVLHDNLRLASDFKPLFLEYPNEYPGILSNQVRLELLAFVDPFPTVEKNIQPMVNEILTDAEILEFDMKPFKIKTQEPYRTLVEKILLQKEIHKDFVNGEFSPETAQERARDFYDIHKIWDYYNGSPPIELNDVKQFIDSRSKNRKDKTSISKDEFNQFSLLDQFKNQQISKQLSKDKSKLSIRDLSDKAIVSSLTQIDDYFKKMI
jgi:predicted nucleotidyltransferase component of viral defense system